MADETEIETNDDADRDAEGGLMAAVDAAELENLRAKAEEHAQLRDQLLRLSADLQNVRRRSEEDVKERVRRSTESLLVALMDGIDELDRALQNAPPTAGPLADGVAMTRSTLLAAGAREGLAPIASVGQAFDPKYHEAIRSEPAGNRPPGTVVAEVRAGYLWNDRVLRPARVIVTSGGAESPSGGAPHASKPLASKSQASKHEPKTKPQNED